METGWVWYRLPPFMDGHREIAGSLGFNRGALEMIDLAVIDPKFGEDWNDWSAERAFTHRAPRAGKRGR